MTNFNYYEFNSCRHFQNLIEKNSASLSYSAVKWSLWDPVRNYSLKSPPPNCKHTLQHAQYCHGNQSREPDSCESCKQFYVQSMSQVLKEQF